MTTPDRILWLLAGMALGVAAALLARPELRGLVTIQAPGKHPGRVAGGRRKQLENLRGRWRCDQCGLETNSGGLANHQKWSEHAGKTQVGDDDNGGARPEPRTAA